MDGNWWPWFFSHQKGLYSRPDGLSSQPTVPRCCFHYSGACLRVICLMVLVAQLSVVLTLVPVFGTSIFWTLVSALGSYLNQVHRYLRSKVWFYLSTASMLMASWWYAIHRNLHHWIVKSCPFFFYKSSCLIGDFESGLVPSHRLVAHERITSSGTSLSL
jgi:hypothetical protein